MHKKMAKAITGSLMAASMLASTAAAFAPMSAGIYSCSVCSYVSKCW